MTNNNFHDAFLRGVGNAKNLREKKIQEHQNIINRYYRKNKVFSRLENLTPEDLHRGYITIEVDSLENNGRTFASVRGVDTELFISLLKAEWLGIEFSLYSDFDERDDSPSYRDYAALRIPLNQFSPNLNWLNFSLHYGKTLRAVRDFGHLLDTSSSDGDIFLSAAAIADDYADLLDEFSFDESLSSSGQIHWKRKDREEWIRVCRASAVSNEWKEVKD